MVQVSLLENLSALADLLSGRLPSLPELPAPAAGATGSGEKKNSDVASRPAPVVTAVSAAVALGIQPPMADEDLMDDDSSSDDARDADDFEEADSRPVESSASSAIARQEPIAAEPATPPAATVSLPSTSATETVASSIPSSAPVQSTGSSSAVSASAPSSPPLVPAELDLEPQGTPPQIVLTEETCGELFQELIRCVGLTIAAGLKKATGLVLASSSRLEILVDSTADFAKKVLDVPDNRARIEAEVLRLTGRSMAIGMRLVTVDPKDLPVQQTGSSAASPRSSAPAKPAPGRPGPAAKPADKGREPAEPPQANLLGEIDPSRDPFVRRVMEAFGASVVRVTIAPSVRTAEAEQSAE